jgi:hypothetical protein
MICSVTKSNARVSGRSAPTPPDRGIGHLPADLDWQESLPGQPTRDPPVGADL